MIDISAESPRPLADVIREGWFPPSRGGKSLHYSTLLRWILRGARPSEGRLVRLDAVRIGHKWCTSRAAAQRFVEALTPRLDVDAPAPTPRTSGHRQRAAERAGEVLERLGI